MKTTKKPSGRQAKSVTAKGLGHHVHWVGSVVLAPLTFPRKQERNKNDVGLRPTISLQKFCAVFVSAEISALPGNLGV